ncbi:MAG: hypothetical protein WCB11_07565, partial [Terriglobales bacterium]
SGSTLIISDGLGHHAIFFLGSELSSAVTPYRSLKTSSPATRCRAFAASAAITICRCSNAHCAPNLRDLT